MGAKFFRVLGAAVLLAVAIADGQRASASGTLFDAIRRADMAEVNALVTGGADVKAADQTGATPLMYAALYAGPDCLKLLIDHGAPVNAVNRYGATALMWAASQSANVKLLVERGAQVNARASDGVTPLVAAARFNNAEAMRILLAAGADTNSQETRTNLLTAAYFAPTPGIRNVLADVHVVLQSAADVKGPVLNRNRGDVESLNRLLDAGVNPKEEVPLITLSLPSFFMAAREGQVAAMEAFVDAGMDPNFKGPKGWTALMLAAGGDTSRIPAMKYLIELGADINALDADGRTALDWALTRGHTEVSRFLESVGAKRNATSTPLPAPVATPRRAPDAIERAVARLQPAGPAFYNRTRCNSCHNQNIPGFAITLAHRQGIRIDEALAGHSMTATNTQWQNRREAVLLGDTTGVDSNQTANTRYSKWPRITCRRR
jgi:ankyrin repeat protein